LPEIHSVAIFGGLTGSIVQRRTGSSRLCRLTIAIAVGLLAVSVAQARTAEVDLVVTGDERMGDELKTLVQTLEKDQPLSGDGLSILQGAQAREAQVAAALRSRGFYDARVTATVSNHPIAEAAALDAIEAKPEADAVRFKFDVDTGPQYRIADVTIESPAPTTGLPTIDRSQLGLATGDPAAAEAILSAESDIIAQLRRQGYALAAPERREVIVDHATREVDVTYVVEAGPTAKMGPVSFTGTEKVNTTFLQRRVPFAEGQPYAPDKITELRDRLTSLGIFSTIRIKPATALDAKGELPVLVELQDRAQRSVGFGISYETQLGVAVNGYWLHRNLFGNAESLRLSAEVNNVDQTLALNNIGYGFRAAFRKPDWWLARQDATAKAEAVRDVLPAYRRKAIILGVGLDRVISPAWRVTAGLNAEYAEIDRYGVSQVYQILGLPLTANLNKANSETNPTRGYRGSLGVAPYADASSPGDFFTILQLTASTYLDIDGEGRSVLALRAALGTIPGADANAIPPDKLFYAGGGGSVRGFVYQTAGPLNAYNNPLGGASLVDGSVEFRQRIGKSFGVVGFVDVGSSYPGIVPDFAALPPRVGAGGGLRSYTVFGPVRLDVGFPVNRRDIDPPFGLYVSLGQAF
jgi:translocation and assembly module TamA